LNFSRFDLASGAQGVIWQSEVYRRVLRAERKRLRAEDG